MLNYIRKNKAWPKDRGDWRATFKSVVTVAFEPDINKEKENAKQVPRRRAFQSGQ